MTTKEFLAIEKRLLPKFPGFASKGPLMFVKPVEHILRGFYFEPSMFNKGKFYVNVFFMPLYVPARNIHLTFGRRIGDDERWSSDRIDLDAALSSDMLKEVPFLMRLKVAGNVARALRPLTKPNAAGYVNPHCYEALAYTLARTGDYSAAVRIIDDLLKAVNPEVRWEAEIASRARLMEQMLLQAPQRATQQLLTWEGDTVRLLGLESSQ